MRPSRTKRALSEEIVRRLARRHSTAAVLLHHAVANRLELGPTDHKVLDLLRERAAATGSELAQVTGLTTGAMTGVINRLEEAGYVRREPDPEDGRKQTLHVVRDRLEGLDAVFGPLRTSVAALLEPFDEHQLEAIAEFLAGATDCMLRHGALLRAHDALPPAEPARPARSRRTR